MAAPRHCEFYGKQKKRKVAQLEDNKKIVHISNETSPEERKSPDSRRIVHFSHRVQNPSENMGSEEETSLIHGLEFQARSLATSSADTDLTKFLVGTQTLKMASNQVHVVEVNEETSELLTQAYPHPVGELWHLHWSPQNDTLISSCYNTLTQEGGTHQKCSLWNIIEDDYQLKMIATMDTEDEIRTGYFHPTEANKFVTVSDSRFVVWDLGKGACNESYSKPVSSKGSHKLTNGKWNPQESGAAFATLQESCLKGWDLRSNTEAWSLEQCHTQCVRDIDYNRNKQHTLASCGDDGLIKIWDLRSLSNVLTLSGHTHWAWCVRYNPLHDELLLSSGSDASGRLWWAASVASEPSEAASKHADGPLRQYTTMEDSVYVSEWSGGDSWTFAMLSYDGRLLIHRVPKNIKYMILDI